MDQRRKEQNRRPADEEGTREYVRTQSIIGSSASSLPTGRNQGARSADGHTVTVPRYKWGESILCGFQRFLLSRLSRSYWFERWMNGAGFSWRSSEHPCSADERAGVPRANSVLYQKADIGRLSQNSIIQNYQSQGRVAARKMLWSAQPCAGN